MRKKETAEVVVLDPQAVLDHEDEEIKKTFPDAGALPGVINEKTLGKMEPVKFEWQTVATDNVDASRMMREYGYGLHPATKRPRAITVLMALEAEALHGNISAAREFLDRTSGKVVELVAINHSKFGGMSDKELLATVIGDKLKKK
jgi:hypothetical protein